MATAATTKQTTDQVDIESVATQAQGTTDKASTTGIRFPRLVPRNLPFYQSKNKVAVIHNKGYAVVPLIRYDWFHVLLRFPGKVSFSILLSIWTGAVLIFAGVYMAYDKINGKDVCRLGTTPEKSISFEAAFAFSVETCTTVGYGLPSGTNAFFESCQGLQFIIYCQMVWSMMFNAFIFAFLYNRIGRCDTRGAQVVNSEKAIVSIVDGQVRFQCRIYDMDSRHPIVEAHVRLYIVMKERPVPRPLRLLQPNDELGGTLLLSFPFVVNHHVDMYSMMHPPKENNPVLQSGLLLRKVDSVTCSREDVICPVCGESYGTHERLLNHVRYNQMVERKEGYPVDDSHLALSIDDMEKPETASMKEIREYFEQNVAEIIVVVEGIDPLLSGTFQALHSYCYEDIIWNPTECFAPCVQISKDDVEVDLDRFHEVHDLLNSERQDSNKDKMQYKKNKDGRDVSSTPKRRRVKQVSQRRHDSFFQ